jgi:hypothetical protein
VNHDVVAQYISRPNFGQYHQNAPMEIYLDHIDLQQFVDNKGVRQDIADSVEVLSLGRGQRDAPGVQAPD